MQGVFFFLEKSERFSRKSKIQTSVYMLNITGTCSLWKFRNVPSSRSMFQDGLGAAVELKTVFCHMWVSDRGLNKKQEGSNRINTRVWRLAFALLILWLKGVRAIVSQVSLGLSLMLMTTLALTTTLKFRKEGRRKEKKQRPKGQAPQIFPSWRPYLKTYLPLSARGWYHVTT